MSGAHKRRMAAFGRAGLYLVTTQELSGGRSTLWVLSRALAAGVRLVQLREKSLCRKDLCRLAMRARALTRKAGALLIINDYLDIALACGADGVHLGQDDLPIDAARRLAPDLIIGASSHSVAQARSAERMGASYVNIGPVYPTRTKQTAVPPVGLGAVRRVAGAVDIPVTVMGGIKERHIPGLLAAGARTIAVVTAVTAAADPAGAARRLLGLIRDI